MRWTIFVKPISSVNTRLKAIGDADLDLVTKGDLIGVFQIGCACPRDPVFQLEVSRRGGCRFINKAEVPRARESGQLRQDHSYKYTDAYPELHLTLEAIRPVSGLLPVNCFFLAPACAVSPALFQLFRLLVAP